MAVLKAHRKYRSNAGHTAIVEIRLVQISVRLERKKKVLIDKVFRGEAINGSE